MSKPIGLVFECLGGGSLSGATGAKIKQQINAIVGRLEATGVTTLKFNANLSEVENQIKSLNTNINITGATALNKGAKVAPVNVPVRFVGANGQEAANVVQELKSKIEAAAGTPAKVTVKTALGDDNQLHTVGAQFKYINEQTGTTVTEFYRFEEAEKGVVTATKQAQQETINYAAANKTLQAQLAAADAQIEKDHAAVVARQQDTWSAFSKEQAAYEAAQASKEEQNAREINGIDKLIQARRLESKAFSDTLRIKLAGDAQDKASDNFENREAAQYANLSRAASVYYQKHIAGISANTDLTKKWNGLLDNIKNKELSNSEISRSLSELKNDTRAAGAETETLGMKMKRLFAQRIEYFTTAGAILLATQALRTMYNNVKELDTAFVQLRIVTKATDADMASFSNTLADSAQKIGASISELAESATTFARLGYSLEESGTLAKLTNIYSNVAAVDAGAATDNITTIIKAYDIPVDQLEGVLDKMTYVGNNFPISAAQLGEGLQNAASALHASGNSLEQSIALLTAAMTTTQDISKSSTGLRTITARIRNTSAELSELGETMDESYNTTAKYEAQLKALSGVDILDANKNFRSTYDILQDLSGVWGTLGSKEKAAITTMIAGVRQSNIFEGLLSSFDEATGAMEAMDSASGELEKAQAVRMDSIEGRLGQLKASFQTFSKNVISSTLVKDIVQILNLLVKLADVATSVGDGILVKVALIAAAISGLKVILAPVGAAIFKLSLSFGEVFAGRFDPYGSALSGWPLLLAAIKSKVLGLAMSIGTARVAAAGATGAFAKLGAFFGALNISTLGWVAIGTAAVAVIWKIAEAIQDQTPSVEELSKKYTELKDKIAEFTAQGSEYDTLKNKTEDLTDAEERRLAFLEAQLAVMKQQALEAAKAAYDAYKNGGSHDAGGNPTNPDGSVGGGIGGGIGGGANSGASTKYVSNSQEIDDELDKLSKLNDAYIKGEILKSTYDKQAATLVDSINKGVKATQDYVDAGGAADEADMGRLKTATTLCKQYTELSKVSVDSAQSVDGGTFVDATALKNTLDSISKSLNSVKSAFTDFSKDGSLSYSTLSGIQEQFGSLDGIDGYIAKLSDAKLTTQQLESTMSEMITKIINSKMATQGVTEATEGEISAMLKDSGAANANEVAHALVANAKLEAAAASGSLTTEAMNEAAQLIVESKACKTTGEALALLKLKKQLLNGIKLDTSADIANLKALYKAAGVTTSALDAVARAKASVSKGGDTRLDNMTAYYGKELAYKDAQSAWDKALQDVPSVDFTGGVAAASSGGGSSKDKDSIDDALKKQIENLERDIELLEKQGASQDLIVKKYKELQNIVHKAADDYRAKMKGVMSDYEIEHSETIKYLSDRWWDYDKAIDEVYDDIKEKVKDALEEIKDIQEEALEDSISAYGDAISAFNAGVDYSAVQDALDAFNSDGNLRNLEDTLTALQQQVELEEAAADVKEKEEQLAEETNKRETELAEKRAKVAEYENQLMEARLKLQNALENKNLQTLQRQEDGTYQYNYVADPDAVENAQEEIEDIQKNIEDSQKDIQETIEENQKDILKSQEEISEAQEKVEKTKQRQMLETQKTGLERQKENLEDYYSDMDALTEQAYQTLYENCSGNADQMVEYLTNAMNDIKDGAGNTAEEVNRLLRDLGVPQNSDYTADESASYNETSSPKSKAVSYANRETYEGPPVGYEAGADYTSEMLEAPNATQFAWLEAQRNAKAEALGIDISGNDPRYRSNDDLYAEWASTHGYASGGEVDFTGPAMVHGTPWASEVIFNSAQAKKLYEFVKDIPSVGSPVKIDTDKGGNSYIIQNVTLPNVKSGADAESLFDGIETFARQYSSRRN